MERKVLLEAAKQGFGLQLQRIMDLIVEIEMELRGAIPATPLKVIGPKKKRKISAVGRKRMAEAQKKRWSAFHAEKAKKTA